MMKRKRISSHRAGLPMRMFFLLMGLIVAGMHAVMFRMVGDTGETAIPLFFIALALFFDAFLLWWAIIFMTQSRVTLYEEGIELERGGAKIFTTWDNVSHFGIKGMGKNQRRGIYLHEKVSPDTKGLVEKILFGWDTRFIPIGQLIHLPTEHIFSRTIDPDKVLETEFGQEVYELAPHLFEEYDEWKPKNRLRDDYVEDSQAEWLQDMSSQQKAHND